LWSGCTETVIDHAQNPRNTASIANADGFAAVTGTCGDTMKIWLHVRNGIIREIAFRTDGCATSIASGSMATELAKGGTIREAVRITQADVLEALGGLPAESQHCALLAASTLTAAVRDYLAHKKELLPATALV